MYNTQFLSNPIPCFNLWVIWLNSPPYLSHWTTLLNHITLFPIPQIWPGNWINWVKIFINKEHTNLYFKKFTMRLLCVATISKMVTNQKSNERWRTSWSQGLHYSCERLHVTESFTPFHILYIFIAKTRNRLKLNQKLTLTADVAAVCLLCYFAGCHGCVCFISLLIRQSLQYWNIDVMTTLYSVNSRSQIKLVWQTCSDPDHHDILEVI